MILSDNPDRRHMCPVTMFLAMAIADEVVNKSQLSEPLPQWTVLKYAAEQNNLAVWRRCSPHRASPSRALKTSTLLDMIRGQISRAGHENTWRTIVDDNRRAARREKKREDCEPVTLRLSDEQIQDFPPLPYPIYFLGEGKEKQFSAS